MTSVPTRTRTSRPTRGRLGAFSIKPYLYLVPTLLILGVFIYYPIIESFRLSLNRVAPFGSQEISVGRRDRP